VCKELEVGTGLACLKNEPIHWLLGEPACRRQEKEGSSGSDTGIWTTGNGVLTCGTVVCMFIGLVVLQ
jgi:hypothetical protein